MIVKIKSSDSLQYIYYSLLSLDISHFRGDPVDLSRLAETLARACCVALTQHLDQLKDMNLTKIGLRVTVDSERVCVYF